MVAFVRQFLPPDDLPSNHGRPEWAIIREVDISVSGQRIDFKFSKGHRVAVVDDAAFENLLAELAIRTFPGGTAGYSPPKWPYGSSLSVNNQGLSYIIYVLADKKWQFARYGAPITVSLVASSKKAYFEGRRIDRSGQVDKGETTKDGCIAAYFIADAAMAAQGDNEYVDRINLHVDLRYEDPATPPTNPPVYMSIIVDPDVRHPGGSGA